MKKKRNVMPKTTMRMMLAGSIMNIEKGLPLVNFCVVGLEAMNDHTVLFVLTNNLLFNQPLF